MLESSHNNYKHGKGNDIVIILVGYILLEHNAIVYIMTMMVM